MTRIEITEVTGSTPIDVFVADYNGNNKTFLGTITGATSTPVPPIVYEYPPSLFDGIESVMVILVDSNGCQNLKIINCV
jgi:hypothetical protein